MKTNERERVGTRWEGGRREACIFFCGDLDRNSNTSGISVMVRGQGSVCEEKKSPWIKSHEDNDGIEFWGKAVRSATF